jgi:autotransporter-associated beta strand protein
LSANTALGTIFVRGTNLGAASGDRSTLILSANIGLLVNGLIPSLVGATSATGEPATFLTTSTITVSAPNSNQFAVVPFTAYTAGTGALGSGAAANTYDVTGAASFSGASAANALRIGAGGSVDIGGGTLTLAAGHVLATGANGGITNGTLAFGANVARFTVNSGSDLSVPAITGTGGLVKSGNGVLTLNAPATLATVLTVGVSQGTLRYGVADALPAGANVFVNSGATLDLNNNNATVATVQGYGNINLGSGNLTLNSGTAPVVAYGGAFSGTGSITKLGTNTVTIAGNSSGYSGTVGILAGTLAVNSNAGIGTGPVLLGDTSGTAQGILSLGATVTNFANAITVQAGSTPGTPHSITAPAGVTTLSGNIAVNNASGTVTSGGFTATGIGLRLNGASGVNGGNITQTGVISGPGGIYIFSGNWSFNGNNTYSGGTFIDTVTSGATGIGIDSTSSGGVVTSGPFGTGPVSFSTGFGSNLRADGGPRTVGNQINISATGGYFGVAGVNPLTLTGTVDLQGATVTQTFNIMNTALTTMSGVIQNGTGGITKNGPGVLALGGANTYTGTTVVNAGTLLANNTAGNAIPNDATVNPGAILGGSGSVGGLITVNPGGVLAPGAAGAPTLTAAGGLTTAAGGILAVRVTDGSTPSGTPGGSTTGTLPNPTSNNFLNVTGGTTTIDPGTVFRIDGTGVAFTLDQPYSYQIASGAGNQSGLNITSAAQFVTVGFAATSLSVTGNASGAIFLSFTPVPEPGTVLGVYAAAAGLVGGVRRWRNRRLPTRATV